MMHSLYFMIFAGFITLCAIVILWAQYSRFKKDGVPFNFTILKILAALSLIMWTGAAQTVYFYDIQPITAAWAAFALGITITIIAVWVGSQILKDWNIITEVSTRDTLTGLWDRGVFNGFLQAEIERSNRIEQPLSILMFHFDDLEDIHKTYGKKSVRMVLREFGSRLTESIRANDLLCCYQEATFALILPHTGEKDAQELSKRLMELLKEPFKIEKKEPIAMTWSLGIAPYTECSFPKKPDEDAALLGRAISAMQVAQEKGGNCIYVSEKDECRKV